MVLVYLFVHLYLSPLCLVGKSTMSAGLTRGDVNESEDGKLKSVHELENYL